MLDRRLHARLRPMLERIARALVRMGLSANQITGLAFGLGIGASLAIAQAHFAVGAVLILVSRLLDGVDGAMARQTEPTDVGGFLDIVLDFLFYASVPLAFAWVDPARNALAAAALLAAFMGTGTGFLAFAVIAAKRQMLSTEWPEKSFYFLGGLTEASETLAVFMAMCLWPQHFDLLAWGFAALCVITIATRLFWGWQRFR